VRSLRLSQERLVTAMPPKKSTQIKKALAMVENHLPELFEVLVARAMDGDKDCLTYLIDRLMGRPHQSLDQRIQGDISIAPAAHLRAIEEAKKYEAEVIEEAEHYEQLPDPRERSGPPDNGGG